MQKQMFPLELTFLVRYSTGELVAIKTIPLEEGEDAIEDIRKEIAILKDCSHPNIVKYLGSFFKDDNLWVISFWFDTYCDSLITVRRSPWSTAAVAPSAIFAKC